MTRGRTEKEPAVARPFRVGGEVWVLPLRRLVHVVAVARTPGGRRTSLMLEGVGWRSEADAVKVHRLDARRNS